MPGQVATGTDASFEALARAARPNQLIHIWAHGDAAHDGRYFSRTGILLAAQGQLPQRGWSNFTEPHLLSPQKLLDAEPRLDFTGSHVTLQACVSAHGKTNFQGDAIGLEWAFLLSGAASVLGTYWHIEYSVAAEFCRRFYAGWLTEKLTRGEAWRQTVQSMMQEAGPSSIDWAAFTLTGDWR